MSAISKVVPELDPDYEGGLAKYFSFYIPFTNYLLGIVVPQIDRNGYVFIFKIKIFRLPAIDAEGTMIGHRLFCLKAYFGGTRIFNLILHLGKRRFRLMGRPAGEQNVSHK